MIKSGLISHNIDVYQVQNSIKADSDKRNESNNKSGVIPDTNAVFQAKRLYPHLLIID